MTNIPALLDAYSQRKPDPADPAQQVSFGTSGHRGSSLQGSFNEHHILAIAQAVAEYRKQQHTTGPMFVGIDTHALSTPAFHSVLQVLAANAVEVLADSNQGYTPTPLVSQAIIAHNRAHPDTPADGLVITPSHNPPEDGGIKYNGTHGGPADTEATGWIQERANALLAGSMDDCQRVPLETALSFATPYEFVGQYVEGLRTVIDLPAIQSAGIRIGVDPMGGTALAVWDAIKEAYDLNIEVVNRSQAPDFAFMPPDHDGKIRMDCSSTAAMANLLKIRDSFDLAFGNDPDADRHGIVDKAGLMNPNHYLAVAIDYLLTHRDGWSDQLAIGKTLVSSSMIDRVVKGQGRHLYEVPVGFKWFVEGLSEGKLAFGGEESAGASFLTLRGEPWSTDKDGIILCLLAAEILAVTGKTPSEYYQNLAGQYGAPVYRRIDSAATPEQKARLAKLRPEDITIKTLAGDPVLDCFATAPGNGAPIGGIKVVTENGWFAARPSGTEAINKVYAESFKDEAHLDQLLSEAQAILAE